MKDSIKHTVTSEASAHQAYRDMSAMVAEYGYITVELKAGKRSTNQNSLYWEWMTVIADYVNEMKIIPTYTQDEIDEYGFEQETDPMVVTKEEMHDTMRQSFLGHIPAKKIGKMIIKHQLKSTTTLTKGEMFHYMEQINAYWTKLGLLLPLPEDNDYTKLRRKHEGGE